MNPPFLTAAQAAIQEAVRDAIRKAYDDGYNHAKMAPDNCSTYCGQSAEREGTAALLSKLRAPVADERAAFEAFQRGVGLNELYLERRPESGQYMWTATKEAWETWQARAALASAPVAGEAPSEAKYRRMFVAACEALAAISERLSLDPNDAEPDVILSAIGELMKRANGGAPQASDAVRILFPTHLRKMWSGGEVQAWLDEHQGVTAPTPSAKGSLEFYRKWQAEQASEAQCSCPSGDGSLRWPCAVHRERH